MLSRLAAYAVTLSPLLAVAAPAHATVSLSYDTPVITVVDGGVATVGVTLANSQDGTTLITDDAATVISGGPFVGGVLTLAQVPLWDLRGSELVQDNAVTQAGSLAGLDLAPGQSMHLELALVTIPGATPFFPITPGYSYTVDLGLRTVQACEMPGIGIGACLLTAFPPPNVADAGVLTIDVVAVPEPASLALLAPALVVLAAAGAARSGDSRRAATRASAP